MLLSVVCQNTKDNNAVVCSVCQNTKGSDPVLLSSPHGQR